MACYYTIYRNISFHSVPLLKTEWDDKRLILIKLKLKVKNEQNNSKGTSNNKRINNRIQHTSAYKVFFT